MDNGTGALKQYQVYTQIPTHLSGVHAFNVHKVKSNITT